MRDRLFNLMYELEDIKAVKDSGHKNCYDLSVTKDHSFLLSNGIVSHNSASSCLKNILGRDGFGYYSLKGKPLNTYNKSFTDNKELSTLYQIVKNEGYKYLVFASDADLDGFHIRGLLAVFFDKHLSEYTNSVGMLQTPVVVIKKNGKIVKWYYNLNDKQELQVGELSEYKKGLGSWDKDDLQYIIKQEGFDKMIEMLDFSTAKQALKNWFDTDSEPRKKAVQENDFSIASV